MLYEKRLMHVVMRFYHSSVFAITLQLNILVSSTLHESDNQPCNGTNMSTCTNVAIVIEHL